MSEQAQGKYTRDLSALYEAIRQWMRAHPDVKLEIDYGPSSVLVTGALPLGTQYWKLNGAAREMLEELDAMTGRQCTMLQFRIAYDLWKRSGGA